MPKPRPYLYAAPRRRLLALSLLLVFCACGVRTLPPRPKVMRRQVAVLARNLAGIPYVYGGGDIDGFDCSGLVHYVYDCFGIRLPRSAREQGRLPGAVKLKHAAAGDVLIFRMKGIWHSAIYLGDGVFVHAPNSAGWVRFEELNEYWLARLRKVVAILPGNG